MKSSKNVEEVELLMENIVWLRDKFPKALEKWTKNIQNCDHETSAIMRDICEKPGTINRKLFSPMIEWLADYILALEGKKAFAKGELDNFLKRGLNRIYRFTVVSTYFIDRPQYFYPNPSRSDPQAWLEADKIQKVYKEYIITLTEKLIGCIKELNFLFLKLSGTIKNLSKDLQKKRNYLSNQCLSLRVDRLKL